MATACSPAEMSATIARYQQLPMAKRPQFAKLALAINSAEKRWTEGERKAFWDEHGAVIAKLNPSQEKEKAIQ